MPTKCLALYSAINPSLSQALNSQTHTHTIKQFYLSDKKQTIKTARSVNNIVPSVEITIAEI